MKRKDKLITYVILSILGIIISFRIFNILNPYIGIGFAILSIYFLTINSINLFKHYNEKN